VSRTAPAQTLEECLALARAHAPAVQVADAGVARAGQAIAEARAARAPSLRLNGNLVQNSEAQRIVFPAPGGAQSFKLGSATALDVQTRLQVPVYTGGRDRALVEAAEAAREARVQGRRQADADLVLRVARAFYRALAARRLQAAAGEALTTARSHHATSAARVRAGAAPRLDSLRATVDVEQRTAAVVRADDAVRITRVELETAIGVVLDPGRVLAEPGDPADTTLPDAGTLVEAALRARPERAEADAALRENDRRLAAARAARRPQVELSAVAQYLGPNRNETYWNVDDPGLKTYRLFGGVGLSMPLYDAGLVNARVGEVAADRLALEAQRRDTELVIRRDVEQALSDARTALTLWHSDRSRIVAAREALRIAEAGYKGGTLAGTDVRDAESALADARAAEAQSLMDYWTARATLDHAIGAGGR
jgi:outer membrane protein